MYLKHLMALFIHQFEQYCFPGGEPAIMNIVLQNSDIPDRYPLNQFTAIIMYGIAIGIAPFLTKWLKKCITYGFESLDRAVFSSIQA